jgi:Ca2+-binding RTX toxin-like protein
MSRRRLLPALIVTVVTLAGPPTAGAATSIELSGGELKVIGDASRNDIEVRRVSDGYLVEDSLERLTIATGSPCFFTSSATPPHQAKCVRASELAVRVEGRPAADDIEIVGGTRGAVLDGQDGFDLLVGGPGPDTLRGGEGADDLFGEVGDDLLDGEAGPDELRGGDGEDTVSYGARDRPVSVTLTAGPADDGNATDSSPFGSRDAILFVENAIGGNGDDVLVGSDANSVLAGRGGNDTLIGEFGDDVLNGGPGADVIGGGNGVDLAFYGDRSAPVNVSLDGQPNDGNPAQDASGAGAARDRVQVDVESVLGGAAADILIGDDRGNVLQGGDGDDTIDGRAGRDDLDGGGGDDTLLGGSDADDVSGGPGQDGVSYAGRSEAVSVSLDGAADDGSAQDQFADKVDVENVTGTVFDDVLLGNASANFFDGQAGNDRLEGRAGRDTLKGSAGSDLLDGGDGVDTASYQGHPSVTVTLDGVANDGTPAGVPGAPAGGEADNALTENVTGGPLADTITGDAGSNELSGGDGDDTIRGAGGNDRVIGGAGLDVLLAEAGNDTVEANDGLTDRVDCGPDADAANLDLADRTGAFRGGGILPESAGCELQAIAPVGRLPNVSLAAERVAVDRRGRAHLTLRCPRRSHRRCAGTVRLQRLDGTDLGAGRFAIRRGGRATVLVRLRRPAGRGVARILARERDVDGRPKLTLARVRVGR